MQVEKSLHNSDINKNYHPDHYQFLWRSGTIKKEKLDKMHQDYLKKLSNGNCNYNMGYHPDDYQFLQRSGTITQENLDKTHESYLQNK